MSNGAAGDGHDLARVPARGPPFPAPATTLQSRSQKTRLGTKYRILLLCYGPNP